MTNTNATNFRNNMFDYLNYAIQNNDIINISTKNGNAIVMSADDYNSLMETLYLMSHKEECKNILEAMEEPLKEGTAYDPNEEW